MRSITLGTNAFAVSLNFANPGVIKFSASVDSFDAMKRQESMNRIEKLFETCFENEMYFSSLFGITDIDLVSFPSSVTMKCAS